MRKTAALSVCLVSAGCTALQPVPMPESVPVDREVQVPVAFFPQDRFQCGPAALAMALDWTGVPVSPQDLTESVYTPARKGSLQPALVTAARRRGRVAYPVRGLDALAAELNGGHPVIVLQNLSLPIWPRWHYAVVIGLDAEANEVMLHSGLQAHRRMELRPFMNTWRRGDEWGLVVLPPDELPASGDDLDWVRAVSGLEAAGRHVEALSAYRAARARWPDSVPVRMGLGNTQYSLGHLAEAESAYRDVIRATPDYGLAWNNLAQTLADRGRTREALEAAKRAVEIGGPYADQFGKTLADIQRAGSK